jgi:Nucleoside 2-deoxyribosyltransferase like
MSTSTTSSTQKCVECKPPVWPTVTQPSIFLAGSIEMGAAIDWQSAITSALSHLPVTIFNPRRDDWDNSWTQDIGDAQFKEQVDWEMDHLNKSDVIALFLQPGTYSPISLLELGMHAADGKMVVCCPTGYWRRGNVQIVCHRYGIPLVETREELIEQVRTKLEKCLEDRNAKSS